jgi:hypothetical protein
MVVNLFELSLADALRTLVPLSPLLALYLNFISSTRFTESISASKYPPRGYVTYRSRVAMFVPFLTPVWGAILSLTGGKREVEELVSQWGLGAREAEAKDRVKALPLHCHFKAVWKKKKKSSRRPTYCTTQQHWWCPSIRHPPASTSDDSASSPATPL